MLYDIGRHESIGLTILKITKHHPNCNKVKYDVICDCGNHQNIYHGAIRMKYKRKSNFCNHCRPRTKNKKDGSYRFSTENIEFIENEKMRFVERYFKPTSHY